MEVTGQLHAHGSLRIGGLGAPAAGLVRRRWFVCVCVCVCVIIPTTGPRLVQPGHYTVLHVTQNCLRLNWKCRGKSHCANAKAVASHVGMFRDINHAWDICQWDIEHVERVPTGSCSCVPVIWIRLLRYKIRVLAVRSADTPSCCL